jgi:uridine kinase
MCSGDNGAMQAMKAVEVPEYDFVTHQRSARTQRVEPADVVIIEGILVLHEPTVCGMLNMKIFVDTDDDVRLARRCVLPVCGRARKHGLLMVPSPGVVAWKCLGLDMMLLC